jgi:hypothetical protein
MTRRTLCTALLLATVAAPIPALAGDFLGEVGQSVARDFKRRNCWPQPFLCPDRQSVREPFAVMVSNGWQRQNLLGDYYFEPGTGKLSESGRLRVMWVLNEAPEQHRVIAVHRGTSPEETAARMMAVQQLVAQNLLPGQMPPSVSETSMSDAGWPADQADIVGRRFIAAIPDPKLPASTTGGAANSGSSSGGSK